MKKLFLILIGFILTGCTYAGPFVTDISKNKDGSITVEKCMVKHNSIGVVSTTDCTSSKI